VATATSDPDQATLTAADAVRRAYALCTSREWAGAERLCRLALSAEANHFEALSLLGIIAGQARRSNEAAELLRRAAVARPGDASVANNLGNALTDLARFDEALATYARALEIDPQYAEAHCNRGNALLALGRREEALSSYEGALAVKPEFAAAWYNRGNALRELNRFDTALSSYDRALDISADYAEAWNNRGLTLCALGRTHDALSSYERALTLSPRNVAALFNQGNALRYLRRFGEALASYDRALKVRPDHPWLYGSWLGARMQLCEWRDLGSHLAQLLGELRQGRRAAPPFALLALADSPTLQRRAAEIWVSATCPPDPAACAPPPRPRGPRLRVGYYSADYHDHATAHLTAGLFEAHDRERFDVVAFSFGPEVTDHMRQRLTPAFDRFVDVRTKSDREIAQLSRHLEIDIAVDLKGFTEDARPGIFARRAAPLQVSYLGYPGTMCAPYIDYIIADRTVVPPGAQDWYSEKVVHLPGCYQVNDRRRRIADRRITRAELGLPPKGFVFCCFNSAHKITPQTFDSWMRVLTHVPGSVLWLLEDNGTASANLRSEAAARGVDPARLIFARRWPLPEHLARHRAAGLFLDTLPYNAHTTASDALWAGLPVLTRTGESFAARVGASLLEAVGLPELITSTPEQYEALAVGLARDPGKLAAIRETLERNRLAAPLFDTESFTRRLESAYEEMYARYQAGGSPEHLCVRDEAGS
jgi:protein O-GlcNAc transferase